ncbi:nuclear receptor coactivator 7 isoform X11 [Bactrocera dorsalis]|uniref:Oxidation resistance protein 1 n=1 Tax=Bactrocera dorsalis TaxID=27457 RepID=A0ABM3JB64_BACDO|nr:nuclear receptor coactivator 7 isoform X11 [Bactrocera dorsalis]
MSIIDSGRYRLRKDWASASIPSLVDIDEHVSDEVENSLNITTPLPPPKPPRRSSLALGLFSSKGDKSQKRRSSIAVFLRRDSNKNTTKDSYESAVKHEKSDGSNTPASPEISFSSAEHVRASSPNEPGKVTYFDDGSSLRPIVKGINNAYDSPVDKERNRRRRSSLQAKLERHRRKNNDISQLSIDNSLPSGSQSDLTNGSMGGSTIGASSGDLSGGDIDPNHSAYFPRQKRHSWWNIFVPDNLKTRSKSRSVDHGLAAPFDLDSLRSKVEGRFESVDRLTNILEGLRPGSPKPGHIERVDSAKSTDNAQAEANKSDDPVITQRFLKINVRHITDGQGVVGGVLLVTPNAVMFDPNVSDPLVIEHGPESYGVIAPMDLVVNAAIFHDIAHMRVSGGVNTEQNENAEIYYPQAVLEAKQAKEAKERGDESVDGARKQSATGGSMETCDDQESLCSNTGEREQKDAEKGVEAKEESAKTDDEVNTKANKTEDDADANDLKKTLNLTDSRTTLEERRKSLLDHHWAIPSKDRLYYLNSRRSSEDEGDNESQTTIDSGARGQDPHSATSSISGIGAASGALQLPGGLAPADLEHLEELAKQSCYDSGIDIREPIANLQPIPKKTVYSDADIVLSSDWVPPKTISPTLMSESPPRSSVLSAQSLDAGTAGGRKKTTSVSFSVDDNNSEQQAAAAVAASAAAAAAQGDKSTEKKNKMLKRLSYPLAWVEGLTGEAGGPPGTGGSLGKSADSESAPNTGDSNQSVFSKVFSSSPITLVSELGGNLFSKTPSEDSGGSPVPPLTPHSTHSEGHISTGRSSIGTFMRPQSSEGTASTTKLKDVKQQPKLDYRSMVSVDDKPELFISVDKLIPRPARACPDPPLYLRLRMGKPIGKAIPLPTSVMSYGKNKLRPEYWFSVPKNRVDELYRFINTWVQHLYGELNEEQIKARGFELIQDDTEWTKSGSGKSGRSGSQENEEISDLTRESWELIKAPFAKTYSIIKTAKHAASHEMDLLSGEVLSMSTDDYRKASLFATGSFDLDFPIPDLIGTTEILTEEHREKLCGHLPARAEGYSWSLIFSTSQHGFSLNSLYRKMQKLESPILIVIQDTDNNVFGALTSCSLHVSDHFYGTGESLLYKFNPSFKVFHWTGENLYFIKGNMESLSIGAGDGRFGLWLDGDLNQGRSQSCSTYGNEPLAPQEDFVIKTLECWAFV